MNDNLKKSIFEAVEDFAANDGAYSDNAMLEINPADKSVRIVDEETDHELDYYDLMDLVEMVLVRTRTLDSCRILHRRSRSILLTIRMI